MGDILELLDFKVEKDIRGHLIVGKKLENSAWHTVATRYFWQNETSKRLHDLLKGTKKLSGGKNQYN